MQGVLKPNGYEAPEVLVGDHCGMEADIWAFGCLMLHLLTGARAESVLAELSNW